MFHISKRLLFSIACLGWYGWSTYRLYQTIQPPLAGSTTENDALQPKLKNGELVDLHIYLGKFNRGLFSSNIIPDNNKTLPRDIYNVGQLSGVPYSLDYKSSLKDREYLTPGKSGFYLVSLDATRTQHLNVTIPLLLREDESLYLFVACTLHSKRKLIIPPTIERLTKHIKYPISRGTYTRERLLLGSEAVVETESEQETWMAHAIPQHILIGMVVDHRPFAYQRMLSAGLSEFADQATKSYWLPTFINFDVSPRDTYKELKPRLSPTEESSNDKPPIPIFSITYYPISYISWSLRQFLEHGFQQLEASFKLPSYDVDSLRMLIHGSSVQVTSLTLLISVLHMLFEILAITSDIQYWKDRTSFVEFSVTSLQLEIVSESIIAFYLLDSGETKMVLYFLIIRILLNLWKLNKHFKPWHIAGFSNSLTEKDDRVINGVGVKELEDFEAKCLRYLIAGLLPVVISVAAYQLIYIPQKSWYSWAIKSMAICAYTGGFVAMTPQLFRNWKLKSVEHLPWCAMTYQAMNTFVDDLFSFIIRMPDMHRMSVFRDDIIFVVFHYQRWLYKKKSPPPSELEKSREDENESIEMKKQK